MAPCNANHSFDPATLRTLYEAFDSVWRLVEARADRSNHGRVRDAIAVALIKLAKTGQRDPDRLEAHAMDQAVRALAMYSALEPARIACSR